MPLSRKLASWMRPRWSAPAGAVDAATLVVPYRSYVFDPETQLRAGHHGASHLPARAQDLTFERHFSRISRKVRQQDQSVGGVQADSNHVEFSHKLIAYWQNRAAT